MLQTLKIKNFALIKSLEINFQNGFNLILGETGAGKSIIIDALNFVLGNKADKFLIRAEEETMSVGAIFSPISNATEKILECFGIETSDDLHIFRSYSQNGKNEVRINGEPVSVSMLKQLGDSLVDAYSQNESIALLKQKNHLSILDSYKPNELAPIKEKLSNQLEKLNFLSSQIKSLGGDEQARARQIDMLNFQINEIENANLKPNEDLEIETTLKKLSNSEKIMSALSSSNELFSGENGVLSLLRNVLSILKNVSVYDETIEKISKNLESNLLDLEENSENLFSLLEDFNFDENLLNELFARRELLNNLKQKYGGNLIAVQNYLQNARQELNTLENAKEILEQKQIEKTKLIVETTQTFDILSNLRHKHAKEIEEKIIYGLGELGMTKSKFKICFNETKIENVSSYSLNNLQDVEFLFSANFGEELKPLAKTISGGEMNRFMLVFKNIIADENSSTTLVFDEIDAGISGAIATSVAKKIAQLSKRYQIICISHLPQVALMGDSYFYVSKSTKDGRTETAIKKLENDEIATEIAMLTYGNVDEKKLEITSESLKANAFLKQNLE